MGEDGSVSESREYHVELDEDVRSSLARLGRLAEAWDGTWRPTDDLRGHLRLPVMAGLRRGFVEGTIEAERRGDGARLTFREERGEYHLERLSVGVLLLGAAGGLITLIAPFVPAFQSAFVLGVFLGLGAWFFIVSGLRNSGPEEFFEALVGSLENDRAE